MKIVTRDYNLQRVSESDLVDLVNISRITFVSTFSWYNTQEDMDTYCNVNLSEDQLFKELRNSNSIFYFVQFKNEIIGFVKINFADAQTEQNIEDSLEIERIYLKDEYHNKGIGKFILNQIIEIANSYNLKLIWLAVWEKNEKAIEFYKRNHFEYFSQHDFVLGKDIQLDYLMKLSLS